MWWWWLVIVRCISAEWVEYVIKSLRRFSMSWFSQNTVEFKGELSFVSLLVLSQFTPSAICGCDQIIYVNFIGIHTRMHKNICQIKLKYYTSIFFFFFINFKMVNLFISSNNFWEGKLSLCPTDIMFIKL